MKLQIKGQGRHLLNTLAGVVTGSAVASTEEGQALVALLTALGVPQELQVVIGFAALALAHFLSWRSPEKKEGSE